MSVFSIDNLKAAMADYHKMYKPHNGMFHLDPTAAYHFVGQHDEIIRELIEKELRRKLKNK